LSHGRRLAPRPRPPYGAVDYPGQNVADGDTLTTISWVFNGGALHSQPVFNTLRDYFRQVSGLVDDAERRLSL
jgi:hypothetical protein